MIVMKENERLYPATWEYNAARILTELARVITNNGGKVKPLKNAVISNRSYDSMKQEYSEKVKRYSELEKANHNETRATAIAKYSDILTELEKVGNNPIIVTHTSYISFVYDGFYYYYQVDANPFFEFHYIKTPVNNGQYSKNACLENDKKEWLYDCFFSITCNNADIVEGANLIFNMLVNARPSIIRRDSRKQRVSNTYNNGYHYETIYSSERFEKIDF